MRPAARLLLALVLPTLACSRLGPVSASPQAPPTETALPEMFVPVQCENTPPATIAALPTAAPQANPPLSPEEQSGVLTGLANAIHDHFIYPEAIDDSWLAEVAAIETRIETGLDTEAFYLELQTLISSLGDEHSYIQSPRAIAEEAAAVSGTYELVGIGALLEPSDDLSRASVLAVFEGGPAWHAGLRPHDNLLAVDGGPIRDGAGTSRTRGPECSTVVLTVQTPGEGPRDLTLMRAAVSGNLPIHARLVPTADGSRVGYLFLATMLDESLPNRVRQALEEFGPLDGLIIDNRMNSGGLGSVAARLLGFFTAGHVGDYLSREGSQPLEIAAEPVHNSQVVPLVILISEDTVSYGEIISGVLRDVGRANLVGQTTLGNVEQLRRFDLEDGSYAWLAGARFEPANSQTDWEATGIVPDVEVAVEWDAFTAETDPAIPAALELLAAD